MPDYVMMIAKEMAADEHWRTEGTTLDGTQLVSCPRCGVVIPEDLKMKHAIWHAVHEN